MKSLLTGTTNGTDKYEIFERPYLQKSLLFSFVIKISKFRYRIGNFKIKNRIILSHDH